MIIIEKPVPVPTPTPAPIPPGSVLLRLRGPEKRWVGELSAAVYGAFALDGNGANEPAGELALGLRRGRFGAALRGDLEGDFTVAAPGGAIKLDMRRAQLALEAHADLPLRVGALRFVFGPTLPLWSARADRPRPPRDPRHRLARCHRPRAVSPRHRSRFRHGGGHVRRRPVA